MKKTALTTIFIVLCTVGTYGYDVCVDGLFYNLRGNSAVVTHSVPYINPQLDGDAYTQDTIIIPEKIVYEGREYTVDEVGDSAFFHATGPISHIRVPSTVTRIGKSAFRQLLNLKSLSQPSKLSELGEFAYYGCKQLDTLEIPSGITVIPDYAYGSIYNVKSVKIPEGVTEIGVNAFMQNRMESISLPSTLKRIRDEGIRLCPNLKGISIPEGVDSIGKNAFYANYNLIEVYLPSSLTYLGENAFYQNEKLESIVLPPNLKELKSKTFYFCSALKHVELPENLERIEDLAFNCCHFDEIVIPASVTFIGEKAFYNAGPLNKIYNYKTVPTEITENVFSVYNTLHVVKGCGDSYRAALNWKNFTVVDDLEPAGISTVKAGAQARAESWYDLQGRQVTRPEKGRIYIHDGRKVVK